MWKTKTLLNFQVIAINKVFNGTLEKFCKVTNYTHVNNAFIHYFFDLGAEHNLFMELPHVRHLTIQECVKWIEKRADISND